MAVVDFFIYVQVCVCITISPVEIFIIISVPFFECTDKQNPICFAFEKKSSFQFIFYIAHVSVFDFQCSNVASSTNGRMFDTHPHRRTDKQMSTITLILTN